MLLYRALNDCDIAMDPKENGICSKKVIMDIIDYYKFLHFRFEPSTEELKKYAPILTYGYIGLILEEAKKKSKKYLEKINNYIQHNNHDNIDLFFDDIIEPMRSINTHIKDGSKVNTDWISFTSDIDCLMNYYLQQYNKHAVAVINSKIESHFDNGTIAFDLSSDEAIANDILLMKNNGELTNKRYSGFNYAKKAKEFIYYNYLSSDQIIEVLTPLEVDLLVNNALGDNFFSLSREQRSDCRKFVEARLAKKISELGNQELYNFFKKIYLEYISLEKIAGQGKIERYISLKQEILAILNETEFPEVINDYKKTLSSNIKVAEQYRKKGISL